MFDKNKLLAKLRSKNVKRAFVQIPEGLKAKVYEISKWFTDSQIDAIISVEPCFGACDLRDNDALDLDCDILIHFGHSDMGIKSKVPVIYEEYKIQFDSVTILKKNDNIFSGFKRIGLISTIQYIDSLIEIKGYFTKSGKKAFIGKTPNLSNGQVLGCNYMSAKSIESKVECFLFVGSGAFHHQGFSPISEKPVFFMDAQESKITEIPLNREKSEIIRKLRIEKAKEKDKFGIFVSTKSGQKNTKQLLQIKDHLHENGKEVIIISADTLTPEKIIGTGMQVLVNTACPRIYEDNSMYGAIILNSDDAMHV